MPLAELNIVRLSKEKVVIESTIPSYPILFPKKSSNEEQPGCPLRISSEQKILSRNSWGCNIAAYISNCNGVHIILEGTSANLLNKLAAKNMSTLTACIRGAICNVDDAYPNFILRVDMQVKLSKCKTQRDWQKPMVYLSYEGSIKRLILLTISRGTLCNVVHCVVICTTPMVGICSIPIVHKWIQAYVLINTNTYLNGCVISSKLVNEMMIWQPKNVQNITNVLMLRCEVLASVLLVMALTGLLFFTTSVT